MERFLKSKFKTGQKIGESPFSLTYNGTTLSGEYPVVIKIYKRGTLNSALIKSMKQKVKTLQENIHPIIVPLLDGDYGWQGFYYVRPYIQGQPLEDAIKNKTLDLLQAEEITIDLCNALSAAHQRGIVHGALKSRNVFLDREGIKLVDFVIEGEIKESLPQKVAAVLSESENLSPEELYGRSATSSSDIFTVAALFYEMITGKKPFDSQLDRLKGRMIPSPSIPKYLQDILQKAMQPDPLLRFRNIEDLATSIKQKTIIEPQIDFDLSQIELENTPHPKDIEVQTIKQEHNTSFFLVIVIIMGALAGIIYAIINSWLMRQ